MTLLVIMPGPLGPAVTTLNQPLVKLKANPLPGLPRMLAKLLALVVPLPLNKVNFCPEVKLPVGTMFNTPP